MRLACALTIATALVASAALADVPVPPPVAAVVDGRLTIGDAQLPIFVSRDWSQPLPEVHRVVIVVHGYERNAVDYARNMMGFGPPADTLVVAPQFLTPEDIAAHHLPDAILRWDREHWLDGEPAIAPAPLSAFDALDEILARLTDRAALPNHGQIVLAGFSAGGQVVQRYAALGKAEDALPLRYVVGSPNTYAFFDDERPLPDGDLGPFPGAAECPNFNRWKYGLAGGLPPYALGTTRQGIASIEQRYIARDVVYLVGADDTNPNHRLLDKSCAGEAQGPTRFARMQAFVAAMKLRNGAAFRQRLWVIDGAPHNEAKVFGSPCGRAVLFGDGNCSDPEVKE